MTYNLFRQCLEEVSEDISKEIDKKFDIMGNALFPTKEEWATTMREHRKYKYQLHKEGKI